MTDDNEGWIEHNGKGIPVDGSEYVHVKFRSGVPLDAPSKPIQAIWFDAAGGDTSMWKFSDRGPEDDIIAYRVVKP